MKVFFALIDRAGHGYGDTVRATVRYFTGCRRRVPIVRVATALWAALELSCLLLGGVPTPTWLWAVWAVTFSTSALFVAAPLAAAMDNSPSATLPPMYREVLAFGRCLLGTGPLAALTVVTAAVLAPDLYRERVLTLADLAMAAVVMWVAVDRGDGGTRTLVGDIRRLAARRQLAPAGVS